MAAVDFADVTSSLDLASAIAGAGLAFAWALIWGGTA